MSTDALALAACRLAEAARKETELASALKAWVKKLMKPTLGVETLSLVAKASGPHVLSSLLDALPESELRKLAKGLDKHNSEIDRMPGGDVASHILSMASGRVAPAPPPPKPPSSGRSSSKPKAVDTNAIRTLGSRSEREAALNNLTAPKLKAYISAECLRPSGVPPNAKKAQLVGHILNELDAADNSVPRLLADSKYGFGMRSN